MEKSHDASVSSTEGKKPEAEYKAFRTREAAHSPMRFGPPRSNSAQSAGLKAQEITPRIISPGLDPRSPERKIFTLDLLQDADLAADASALALGYNVPVAMPLLSILVSLATALGTLVRVKVGAVWTEPALLWGLIVAEPASRKSDMVALPKGLLRAIEKTEQAKWETARDLAQQRKNQATARWKLYESELRQAIRKDLRNPEPPTERPEAVVIPIRPGIIIEDSSIEDLTETLAGSPRGVVAIADEASTLLKRGKDSRERMLQATKAGSLKVSRISRASRELTLGLSVMAGTQPDRVKSFIGSEDDGLAGRFLWVWVDTMPKPRISREPMNLDHLMTATARVRAMGQIAEPQEIPLSEEGVELLESAMRDWTAEGEQAGGLMRSWLTKSSGHAARLSLILEVYRAARRSEALPKVISADCVAAAVDLIDTVFKSGMQKVAREVGQDRGGKSKDRLLSYIKANQMTSVNVRTLRRGQPGLFGDSASLNSAVTELVEDRILTRADRKPGATGRQPGDYVVDWANLATFDDPTS